MVTAGARPASSGQPPGPISSVKAVTLDVVTVTARIAGDFGIEAGALPVMAEPIDDQPVHPVVGQRPGGELDFARVRIAPALGDLVEHAVDSILESGW